jgi:hypothetical protein
MESHPGGKNRNVAKVHPKNEDLFVGTPRVGAQSLAREGSMKSVVFLRIASVLTLIHSVLHTVGGVFGKPAPGPAAATDAIMRANQFVVFGVTRTYFDFLRGMGLGVTIFLTAEAIVFWQLGTLAKTDAARLRPVMATFMVAYLVFAANSFVYFFAAPVIVEILIAACLGMAIASAKAKEPAGAGQLAAGRA